MPGTLVGELTDALAEETGIGKIPVIAVSAYAYEKDKAAAIESGCNEFLTKPISPDLLKDTINKYLKNT